MRSSCFPFYRLVERGAAGLACDQRGVALGPAILVEAVNAAGGRRYHARPADEIARTLALAYGPFTADDLARRLAGRDVAARALEAGEIALAGIAAALLKLPALSPEAMAKLAAEPTLKKYSPDQPRDERGRWTDEGGASGGTDDSTSTERAQVAANDSGAEGGAGSATKGKINWRKIGEFEGNRVEGYVPAQHGVPLGHSGVTIGMGVDLGSMTEGSLDALDIAQTLKDKLRPYLGLRGAAAQEKLKANALRLDQEEVDKLNAAVQKSQIDALRKEYDAAMGPSGTKFDGLPEPAQTVIASVKFQWGDIWHHPNPEVQKFWKAAVAQDWAAAHAVLRQWTPGTYRTRRNAEAAYLAPLITAKTLAEPAAPAAAP